MEATARGDYWQGRFEPAEEVTMYGASAMRRWPERKMQQATQTSTHEPSASALTAGPPAKPATTFIYRCRRCKSARRVAMLATKTYEGYGRWGVRYSVAPGQARDVDQCCGAFMVGNRLQATCRPEVKCNAKCTGAVGFICDCSCAGKNHGSGGGLFTGLQLAAAA